MAMIRKLVDDVDEALKLYRALGFKLADRWGPPFVNVKRKGIGLWLSGPGTSARKKLESGATPEPGGWNRIVLEAEDIAATVSEPEEPGFKFRAKPIKGPGGQQSLIEDPYGNPIEIFQPETREA